MLLLGLLLVPGAPAQTPEGLPVAVPGAGAVASISGDSVAWHEERGTARMEAALVSLARSADGGAWLLGLEDGSLWRSLDGARTWSRVLRSPDDRAEADEEAVLLEGEALALEAAEEAGSSGTQLGEDDAGETVQVEVAGDMPDLDAVLDDPLLRREEGARGAEVWFHPTDPELALAGRGDGIWRSADGGRTWRRVDSGADAWSFLSAPELGVLVAGTGHGIRVSPDLGVRWFDPVDVTDGLQVDALTTMGGSLLAGTAGGLYRSRDGLRWTRLPLDSAVTALLPDPAWPGGLWVGTPGGVLRTDDDGATFVRQGRQVLPRLRGLGVLPGQGHLLAWSDDGVWESLDGGVTWVSLYRGLSDPDIRDVVVVDALPVAAGSRSIWRFGFARAGLDTSAAAVSHDQQVHLGDLVDTATRRTGLELDRLRPGAVVARSWMPVVQVRVLAINIQGRDSALLTLDTVDGNGTAWYADAGLCFGRCSTSLLDSLDSGDEAAVEIDGLEESVQDSFVLGDELLGEGTESVAAANAAQNIRKYRQLVADQVVGAWSTLQALQRTGRPASLAAQVTQLLDLQEAEARLDLYTDGAYSRAKLSE